MGVAADYEGDAEDGEAEGCEGLDDVMVVGGAVEGAGDEDDDGF